MKIVLVSEAEIADAIRVIFEHHRLITEGSAALSVAYLLKHPERFKGKTVVPIVCGKNIGTELFKRHHQSPGRCRAVYHPRRGC